MVSAATHRLEGVSDDCVGVVEKEERKCSEGDKEIDLEVDYFDYQSGYEHEQVE